MSKEMKFVFLAFALIALLAGAAIIFVTPQRALSASIMRDCIDVVKDKIREAGPLSIKTVTAIQSEPNKRKLEDFSRATQAVIGRGSLIPSEPEVLLEFETNRGADYALCKYHTALTVSEGTYSVVSLKEVQIGLRSLSNVEIVLRRPFSVGYFDRFLSLAPIFGTEQKFYLD